MIRTTIVGYGEISVRLTETYMYRLDNHLATYYPAISWSIHNALLKEATTHEMLRHLKEKVLVHNPNIIFINLSSHESCSISNKLTCLSEFEDNLTKLISSIRSHNNRTGLNGCIPIPLIITPPPVNEGTTGMARTNNRLKQYVYIMKEVAKSLRCPLINLFEEIMTKEDYTAYISEDGYSMSQKGHDLLYDLVFIELTRLINYQGVIKDRDIVREDEFKS